LGYRRKAEERPWLSATSFASVCCKERALMGRPSAPTRSIEDEACTLAEDGDFAAATAKFQQAIAADPARVALHEQLAQFLLEDGDVQAAHDAAMHATELSPQVGERAALAAPGRPALARRHLRACAGLDSGAVRTVHSRERKWSSGASSTRSGATTGARCAPRWCLAGLARGCEGLGASNLTRPQGAPPPAPGAGRRGGGPCC